MHWFAWWKMCVPKEKGGMGFRDLHCFNLALLAKQCWRLLCEPESLCARVLKAKYFPNVELLQATLKNGSFFTWQSIMKGLDTFKLGYIGRIGTGEHVNIWNDPWILDLISMKPSMQIGVADLVRVSDLIDADSGSWKPNEVHANLIPS